MDNKRIAKYSHDFIGGNPSVYEYNNDDNTKIVDVMCCKDGIYEENATYATIGLSNFPTGKVVNHKELRVELLMAGNAKEDVYGNIISSAAFVIQEAHTCDFGMIIDNVVKSYINNSGIQHVVLMHPVFWPQYKVLEDDDEVVAWLLAIPISDTEKDYILNYGIDAFDQLLEEKNVDVSDLYRESCI